jgi:hypothetical protein
LFSIDVSAAVLLLAVKSVKDVLFSASLGAVWKFNCLKAPPFLGLELNGSELRGLSFKDKALLSSLRHSALLLLADSLSSVGVSRALGKTLLVLIESFLDCLLIDPELFFT